MDGGAGPAEHSDPGRRSISSAAASRRRLPPAEIGHGHDGGASMRSSASISRANSPYVLIDGLDFSFWCCARSEQASDSRILPGL